MVFQPSSWYTELNPTKFQGEAALTQLTWHVWDTCVDHLEITWRLDNPLYLSKIQVPHQATFQSAAISNPSILPPSSHVAPTSYFNGVVTSTNGPKKM